MRIFFEALPKLNKSSKWPNKTKTLTYLNLVKLGLSFQHLLEYSFIVVNVAYPSAKKRISIANSHSHKIKIYSGISINTA